MLAVLIRLYPARWRARYGDEFMAVLEERPLGPFDVLDVLLGALDAQLHLRGLAAATDHQKGFTMSLRIGGYAAIVGSLLWFAGFLANALDGSDDAWPTAGIILAGTVVLLVGIAGLSAFAARKNPVLGWAAFLVPAAGAVAMAAGLLAMGLLGDAALAGDIGGWALFMLGLIALMVGSGLFALASWRTGMLSRPGTVLLGACGLLVIPGPDRRPRRLALGAGHLDRPVLDARHVHGRLAARGRRGRPRSTVRCSPRPAAPETRRPSTGQPRAGRARPAPPPKESPMPRSVRAALVALFLLALTAAPAFANHGHVMSHRRWQVRAPCRHGGEDEVVLPLSVFDEQPERRHRPRRRPAAPAPRARPPGRARGAQPIAVAGHAGRRGPVHGRDRQRLTRPLTGGVAPGSMVRRRLTVLRTPGRSRRRRSRRRRTLRRPRRSRGPPPSPSPQSPPSTLPPSSPLTPPSPLSVRPRVGRAGIRGRRRCRR